MIFNGLSFEDLNGGLSSKGLNNGVNFVMNCSDGGSSCEVRSIAWVKVHAIVG